ncbi:MULTISPECIES: PepSY-associated TM helix domain-containing protein [unclassified Sphingobium]|uniref:PepSY-associated TM helix domain-containing protein n=1 Tax=unclassified Sphingobium TaxID=2611147 RepID=UPI0022242D13|nr:MULTISPECIES: PepSY-associated TM helix domain-containing protein [unclassified Sphingobium]MCW2382947.1 putative iron-regulated membrane protein [Sphingobium sp. B2D3B]MCW2400077.1 putative iron-regulated membrane protein [Sphingobium sp. B2D3C]
MTVARKPKPRSIWWRVHSWAGLKLSIFLTFILATGTLAVFAHEIDWLVTPAMRVTQQDGPVASWGAIAQAAARAEPEGRLQMVHAPLDPWFAAEAWVDIGKGSPRRVYVDPWEAQVTGTHGWANVHRFLRQVHRHLMLPTKIGIPIVSALSLLLLASLVTGIVTYKKWWRGFFRAPRRGDSRRFHGDLHRLAGLWCLWFVALITLTGLWYLVETLGGRAPVPELPEIAATPAPPPTGAALDRLVVVAHAAKPTLSIREIRFTPDNGVIFLGQDQAWLVRDRANGVAVDPSTGRVTALLDGRDLNVHQRISEMADPLHFGDLGGLPTKIVWFLFGVLMTGLSVTGTIIYARRLQKADVIEGGALRAAWTGMGVWAYIATALILLALVLTPGAIGGAS